MKGMQRILIGITLGFAATFTSNGQWTMTTQPAQATDANCLAAHGSTLFAAIGNDGIFSTTDNGTTWTSCNAGLTDTDVSAMASVYTSGGNARLLAGTSSGAFYSTNEGASWQPCAVLVNNAVRAFASGTDSLNIYAGFGQKGAYVSTDGGANWAPANKGIAQEFITALAVLPGSTRNYTLFAGTGDGVFRSSDKGTTWSAASNGLTGTEVQDLIVSRGGSGGYNLFAIIWQQGVFRSTDGGDNWTAQGNGLSNEGYALAAYSDPKRGPVVVYSAGRGLAYATADNGASWIDRSAGLPNLPVTGALAVCGNYLYCGIHLSGIWRRPLSELVSADRVSELPTKFELDQNFPNPFSAKTTIGFSLPRTEHVTLEIYNSLGMKVVTLLDEGSAPGKRIVSFDAKTLDPGTYFTVLQTPTARRCRLISVIK